MKPHSPAMAISLSISLKSLIVVNGVYSQLFAGPHGVHLSTHAEFYALISLMVISLSLFSYSHLPAFAEL
jgi:hypothetical protein